MCARARAFHAVTELLFGSVLKVGFYIMKWNVVSKCVCVCVELLFCLSLRYRTIFYIGTLLILMACVCVCVCVRACVRACVCACMHVRSCRCEYVRLGVVLLVQMSC